MDCIFCKIVAGQIPGLKLYEDDNVLSFLDVFPANPGHALVVPKAHYEDLAQVPEGLFLEVMRAAKSLAPVIVQALEMDGFNLFLNNGRAAGQAVGHIHVHIVPRKAGDGLRLHFSQEPYPAGEAEKVQARILSRLG